MITLRLLFPLVALALATMWVSIATAASSSYGTDTTMSVTRGTSLELTSFGGDVTFRTWSRSSVRVVADHQRNERVRITRESRLIRVESEARRGTASIDYVVTVPAWLPVHIDGVNLSVRADGLDGGMTVTTVNGEIRIDNGAGTHRLESVQGEIVARAVRGRVFANAVNGEIELERVTGAILAETVNGQILLHRVDADTVQASTVNGTLCFDGPLRPLGVYRLASHNGDIAVGLPADVGARVMVETYMGAFRSDFPVEAGDTKRNKHGQRFVFKLGRGGPLLDLESFQGLIWLRRPGALWKEGEPPCAEEEEHEHEEEEEESYEDSDE